VTTNATDPFDYYDPVNEDSAEDDQGIIAMMGRHLYKRRKG